jgi:hypothetical protein
MDKGYADVVKDCLQCLWSADEVPTSHMPSDAPVFKKAQLVQRVGI